MGCLFGTSVNKKAAVPSKGRALSHYLEGNAVRKKKNLKHKNMTRSIMRNKNSDAHVRKRSSGIQRIHYTPAGIRKKKVSRSSLLLFTGHPSCSHQFFLHFVWFSPTVLPLGHHFICVYTVPSPHHLHSLSLSHTQLFSSFIRQA